MPIGSTYNERINVEAQCMWWEDISWLNCFPTFEDGDKTIYCLKSKIVWTAAVVTRVPQAAVVDTMQLVRVLEK